MRNITVRFFIGTVFMLLALVVFWLHPVMKVDKRIAVAVSVVCLLIALYFKVTCFWMAWKDGRKITDEIDRQFEDMHRIL